MSQREAVRSEDGKTLKITINWFGWGSVFVAIFTTIWISFLVSVTISDKPIEVSPNFLSAF